MSLGITAAGVGTALSYGGAAYSGYKAVKGAVGSNKKNGAGGASYAPPKYEGYRPPAVGHLRPVEDQITEILMQRSKGQDVGYDPERRNELLQNFEIQQDRDLEERNSDLQNRISGMGLSRNPAVYDELMGRATREAGREKNLYTNRVDIEDLARRNEERDVNTGRLQNLNTFNFGQENNRAKFDLDVYNSEQGFANDAANRNDANYQDPLGSGIAGAADIYSMLNGKGGGVNLSSTPSPAGYDRIHTSSGAGVKKDAYGNYFTQLALQGGKNLGGK